MKNPIYRALVIVPAALIVFYLSMWSGFNVFDSVFAWTNPSATPPSESLTPIPVTDGGTGAASAASARADLGAAASGANSDITSLTPSNGSPLLVGNNGIILSTGSEFDTDQGGSIELGGNNSTANPISGGVPYIDFHYGTGSAQDFNVRLQNNANDAFQIMGSGGALTLNVGTDGSSDTLIVGNGSGQLQVGNIKFSDGTIQTTAYVNPANGSQTWTTPGAYTWTVPSGVTRLFASVIGAGGGAETVWGYSNTGASGAGGGCEAGFLNVTPGEFLTIEVGAGGAEGARGSTTKGTAAGSGGGSSSIANGSTTVLSATGGAGGTGNGATAPGGVGGGHSGMQSYTGGGGFPNSGELDSGYPGGSAAGPGGNGQTGSGATVSGGPGWGILPAGGNSGVVPGGGGADGASTGASGGVYIYW